MTKYNKNCQYPFVLTVFIFQRMDAQKKAGMDVCVNENAHTQICACGTKRAGRKAWLLEWSR